MELISSSGILDVTHSYCMLLLYPSTLCQDGPSYPRGRTIGCSGMRHELDPPLLRSVVRPPLNLSQTWSGHQVHSVPVNVPLIEFWKQWEWKGIYRRVIISYLGVVRKKQWFYPEKSRSCKQKGAEQICGPWLSASELAGVFCICLSHCPVIGLWDPYHSPEILNAHVGLGNEEQSITKSEFRLGGVCFWGDGFILLSVNKLSYYPLCL